MIFDLFGKKAAARFEAIHPSFSDLDGVFSDVCDYDIPQMRLVQTRESPGHRRELEFALNRWPDGRWQRRLIRWRDGFGESPWRQDALPVIGLDLYEWIGVDGDHVGQLEIGYQLATR